MIKTRLVRSLPLPLVASLSLVAATGCPAEPTSPADAAAIRARIQIAVPPIVDGAARAASASTAAPGSSSSSFDGLARTVGKLSIIVAPTKQHPMTGDRVGDLPSSPDAPSPIAKLIPAPIVKLLQRYHREPLNTLIAPATFDPPPPPVPTEPGEQLALLLTSRIFTDSNYDDGRFHIPTALICGDAPSPECQARAELADLEMSASLRGKDGIDLTLLAGADHRPAIMISMSPKQAQFSIDLAGLEPAITAMAGGAPANSATGVISGDVALWGDDDLTGALHIDEAIHVAAGGSMLDVAASAPALSVHLDGPHHQIVTSLALGEVQVQTLASDSTAATAFDLPGLAFAATARAGQALDVTGLSLGARAATTKIDGKLAASLDLNPDDGRAVDLRLDTEADTGALVLEAKPRLDVRLAVDYAALGETAPAVQIKRALLDASGQVLGAVRFLDEETQVIGGRLTIETTPVGGGVFEAGTCVGSDYKAVACESQTPSN